MARRGLLTEEELQIVRKKLTDEEAIAKFERDCQLKNLRHSTIKFYKGELKAIKSSLVQMGFRREVVELKKKDIEQLILHLKDKIRIVSINTKIRALSAFFNYLYRISAVTPNHMKNIEQLRDRQRVIETLEDDEILKLTKFMKKQGSFIGERDLTIFGLMLDTGIRLAETAGIKVEDVREKKLIIRNTKNLEERLVYPKQRQQAIETQKHTNKTSDFSDGSGGYEEELIPIKTIWADVRPLSGREYYQAQAVQADITHMITIRKTDIDRSHVLTNKQTQI